MTHRVAVLVPCYNEEAAIAQVVRDFRAALPEATVYVYDNNSKDQTTARARDRILDQNLQLARVVHRQAATHHQAEDGPEHDDQRRHHEVVGNDATVGRDGAAERAQRRGNHGAERSIDRLDDPEFVLEFFH